MKMYFRHKIQNLIAINEIVTIEYLDINKNFDFRKEKHNFWELVYCDKNNVVCEYDGKNIDLREGEILFFKPNRSHVIHSNGVSDASVFVFCFVCNSESMEAFSQYHKVLNKQNKTILSNIIDEMKHTFVFPFNQKLTALPDPILGGQEVIKNYLELLLIFLLREEEKQATKMFLSDRYYESQLATLIEEYLKNNVCAAITIADVCKHFNYSKAYISRIFKENLHDTIKNHHNKLKIEEAKKLLSQEHLPIAQISDKLCFGDPHYFCTAFKKFTGIPPSRYVTTLNHT